MSVNTIRTTRKLIHRWLSMSKYTDLMIHIKCSLLSIHTYVRKTYAKTREVQLIPLGISKYLPITLKYFLGWLTSFSYRGQKQERLWSISKYRWLCDNYFRSSEMKLWHKRKGRKSDTQLRSVASVCNQSRNNQFMMKSLG